MGIFKTKEIRLSEENEQLYGACYFRYYWILINWFRDQGYVIEMK